MPGNANMTSLGFMNEQVPVGTHMCLIFSSEEERVDCILKFLLSGIHEEALTSCFSNTISEEIIRTFLKQHDVSYDKYKEAEMLFLSKASDVYFKDGEFVPQRMLDNLKAFYNRAIKENYSGARVIGEMLPEVQTIPGGEMLFEYECRVSMLVKTHPVTSICQYDANLFDGATILEVLKVHPKMLVNGAVVNNPFFVEPEEYLRKVGCDC